MIESIASRYSQRWTAPNRPPLRDGLLVEISRPLIGALFPLGEAPAPIRIIASIPTVPNPYNRNRHSNSSSIEYEFDYDWNLTLNKDDFTPLERCIGKAGRFAYLCAFRDRACVPIFSHYNY